MAVVAPNFSSAPLTTIVVDVGGVKYVEKAKSDNLVHSSDNHDLDLLQVLTNSSRTPSDITSEHPIPRHSNVRLLAIGVVAVSMAMITSIGNSALNIALPTIQKDLNMRETDLQWLVSAYSLTNGCFLLLSGRMADVHGRKLVFLCGVGWYSLWSLVGPFIGNGAGLIVSRALTGCGASMAIPSAIGIIASTFHGRARVTAFAVLSSGAPVGGAMGLVLGGVLTVYAPTTWRAALWVNSGIAAGVGIAAYFVFPPDVTTTEDKRIDLVGASLITVGLILLQFVISYGEAASQGWKTPYIIVLLIVSVFFVAGFFFWEHHVIHKTSRPPLMRLGLWTRAKGRLAAVYCITFISMMGFMSIFYQATLFYQQVQNLSPIQAMLRFLPMCVSGALCNVLVAYTITKVPTQLLICVGIFATGIANVLFAISPADVNYWRLPFNSMWLSVLGADFLMSTGMTFVSRLAMADEQSVAGALFQTLVQLAGSLGVTFTSVASHSFQTRSLKFGHSEADGRLTGIHSAFWVAAGCSFSAFILAAVILHGMGTYGKGKGAEKHEETNDKVTNEQDLQEDEKD